MAKTRSRSNRSSNVTQEQVEPLVDNSNNATVTNTNTGERKMAGLTPEQIAALLGKSRTKGDYVVKLNDFIESGEGGVCVNEEWVELKDKKSATLKQGFEGAKGNKEAHADAEFVKVMTDKPTEGAEAQVYLINLKVAGQTEEAAA